MRLGFSLPARGPLARPDGLTAMAKRGEELGYDIVSVSDHVIIPFQIDSTYPYSQSGRWGSGATEYLEQLTVLAYVAGQTSTIRLLSSVMVLPHRHPILAAKMLATIDVLSGGRLIFGCGTGWMREEFEALGAPPFEERGAVSDEYLHIFKELWSNERPSFEGTYASFQNIGFAPKPVQQPHPPIWVGGESPPAIRRAARLGDAWYPINGNPTFPLGTQPQLRRSVERLRAEVARAGRSQNEVGVVYNSDWFDDRERQFSPEGERLLLTGSPDDIRRDITFLREMDVHTLMLGVQEDTLDATFARMEQVMDRLQPMLAGN